MTTPGVKSSAEQTAERVAHWRGRRASTSDIQSTKDHIAWLHEQVERLNNDQPEGWLNFVWGHEEHIAMYEAVLAVMEGRA